MVKPKLQKEDLVVFIVSLCIIFLFTNPVIVLSGPIFYALFVLFRAYYCKHEWVMLESNIGKEFCVLCYKEGVILGGRIFQKVRLKK
jgi:hypothetical protein